MTTSCIARRFYDGDVGTETFKRVPPRELDVAIGRIEVDNTSTRLFGPVLEEAIEARCGSDQLWCQCRGAGAKGCCGCGGG